MKNKKTAIAIAILLALLCFVPILFLRHGKGSVTYEIVCFGDSVMACKYGPGSVPDILEQETGLKALNAAFGGLTMSEIIDNPNAGDGNFFFSMTELSKAFLNRDFSLQVMATKRRVTAYPEAWYTVASNLDKIDYDSIKYVLIEHGVNDYLTGKQIEDTSDKYNANTFAGGLRTVIENVQKAVPDATIILATPTYVWFEGTAGDCTETDYGGGTLPEYVEAEKRIAAEYNLICVDNFNGSGINRDNYKSYLYDGLHSIEEGNRLIAENIIKNVEGFNK